jgi:hypothetical protein
MCLYYEPVQGVVISWFAVTFLFVQIEKSTRYRWVILDSYKKSNLVYHELHKLDNNAVIILGYNFEILNTNRLGAELLALTKGIALNEKVQQVIQRTRLGEVVSNEELVIGGTECNCYLMKAEPFVWKAGNA